MNDAGGVVWAVGYPLSANIVTFIQERIYGGDDEGVDSITVFASCPR